MIGARGFDQVPVFRSVETYNTREPFSDAWRRRRTIIFRVLFYMFRPKRGTTNDKRRRRLGGGGGGGGDCGTHPSAVVCDSAERRRGRTTKGHDGRGGGHARCRRLARKGPSSPAEAIDQTSRRFPESILCRAPFSRDRVQHTRVSARTARTRDARPSAALFPRSRHVCTPFFVLRTSREEEPFRTSTSDR